MMSYPAQYGFEAFSVPDYSLELTENEHYRFTINEGEYSDEWIEIYDLSFSDEPDENGESLLKFEFQSSLGEDNVVFNELAQKLIKEVIIRSMEHAMRNEEQESSLGEDNVVFNELAQKLIKEVIIRSMEHAMRNEEQE